MSICHHPQLSLWRCPCSPALGVSLCFLVWPPFLDKLLLTCHASTSFPPQLLDRVSCNACLDQTCQCHPKSSAPIFLYCLSPPIYATCKNQGHFLLAVLGQGDKCCRAQVSVPIPAGRKKSVGRSLPPSLWSQSTISAEETSSRCQTCKPLPGLCKLWFSKGSQLGWIWIFFTGGTKETCLELDCTHILSLALLISWLPTCFMRKMFWEKHS